MTEPEMDTLGPNAQKARELASGWIASADVKASALLAVAGAVLAIALASPAKGGVEAILMGLFSVGTVVSIAASAFVIFPRTDRIAILREAKCPEPLEKSPSYFSDIGQLEFPDFMKFVSEIDETMKRRDALEQAYVMVFIARRKMRLMRLAVFALAVSMFFLGAAVLTASGKAFFSKDEPAERKGMSNNAGATAAGENTNFGKKAADISKPDPEMLKRGTEIRTQQPSNDGGAKGATDTSKPAPENLKSVTESRTSRQAGDSGISDEIDAGVRGQPVPNR